MGIRLIDIEEVEGSNPARSTEYPPQESDTVVILDKFSPIYVMCWTHQHTMSGKGASSHGFDLWSVFVNV